MRSLGRLQDKQLNRFIGTEDPLAKVKSILIYVLIALLKMIQHRHPWTLQTGRFLFPAYTGLGNFIMMTPVISTLHKLNPSAQIQVIAGNEFGTEFVLAGTEMVNRTWILPEYAGSFRKLLYFWKLRRERIDFAFVPFDASPSFYRFGVMLAGIPRRIGHTSEVLRRPMGWTRRVLTDAVPVRAGHHETELHFDLLEVLVPGVKRSYQATVRTADDGQTLKRFGLTENGYIVLQVSAANGTPSPKVWPLENFRRLAERLSRSGFTVVLAGDGMEKPIVDRFAETCSVPVVNLAGRTTVLEVASLIKNATALVCHDSALMHIGNATGTPLIALYGPTDYLYTKPMGEKSQILRKDLSCAPCMANFAKTEEEAYRDCPIQFDCMRRITVDEVFEAIMRQVNVARDVSA